MKHIWRLIIIGLLTILVRPAYSQATADEIRELEKSVSDLYGLDKLKALNKIGEYYLDQKHKKASKYTKQAENLADDIFNEGNVLINQRDIVHYATASYLHGLALYQQEKYNDAEQGFLKSAELAAGIDDDFNFDRSQDMLAKLDSIGVEEEGFLKRTIGPLGVGDKISSASQDIKISTILKMASSQEKKGNYPRAIENYKKAAQLMKNKGDAKAIADVHAKIAMLNQKDSNLTEAIAYYQITENYFEKLGDTLAVEESRQGLRNVFDQVKEVTKEIDRKQAIRSPQLLMPKVLEDDSLGKAINNYRELALQFEAKQDYTQSLRYYKLYNELNSRRLEEQRKMTLDSVEMVNQAQQIQLLLQENDLNELQISRTNDELERASTFRKGLFLGIILLAALLALFYWLFVTKKRAHKNLQTTFTNLEMTKGKLVEAEQKIKKLLGQQVSDDIAEALLSDEGITDIKSKFVCVMFLDIRDFTPFAEAREPQDIISYQNDVFGFMIEIVAKYHGVINQFMGDGFMATFGAPASYGNDTKNAFLAAQEIVAEVNARSEAKIIEKTRIGIGLHAGEVVAGNVGTEIRKQYSITGNTVITAARIEQLNKTYHSQLLISEEVATHLDQDDFAFDEIIETKIKGRKDPIKIYKVA
ncbi:adenylate/guanylate cyclase domain-containing protein [Fulvivirga lutimaris]|uniref:adenylate/guanylate cyclase domain-containing protein n=1 Tax=Fulvivirga lutimaris TaxID=1819566 RepID=UPI0012BBAF70|nr:adenylate/guanylate cyclase domain-containing protein [Fulvivirga lutimaris]MTI40241.1 adenylate/guanylate cyclase domain-containing protein [Fulvivirga lutimaris]